MQTGTVTLHSWNDGIEEDEADPPMGTNYNSRLDVREDYTSMGRHRGTHGGLRSRPVRTQRMGMDEEDDGNEEGGPW